MPKRVELRNRRALRAAGARQRSGEALLPHELLLKIARGAPVDGHQPTFAERMTAARQALPYFAARLAPEKAKDDDGPLIVNVMRFSESATIGGGG